MIPQRINLVSLSLSQDKLEGEQIHPRKWNHEFIDMPAIDKKKQKTPSFTGEVVTGIVRLAAGLYRMLFIICAAAGLRIGEALGIDIKDISPDCSTIVIKQKAWRGQIHDRLTPPNGDRVIDLHPTVAALLQDYIGTRQAGLLFCSRMGKQLWQSNILRRHLHPIMKKLEWNDAELGIDKAGSHAFRRFRNTYLRNHTSTPQGLYKFWMGHAGDGCQTCTIKSGMTLRSAKKLLKELVWASSFRLRMPLLDRMDRKSDPSQFWKWLQVFDSREINGRGEWI